jgi:hypothetical protein
MVESFFPWATSIGSTVGTEAVGPPFHSLRTVIKAMLTGTPGTNDLALTNSGSVTISLTLEAAQRRWDESLDRTGHVTQVYLLWQRPAGKGGEDCSTVSFIFIF